MTTDSAAKKRAAIMKGFPEDSEAKYRGPGLRLEANRPFLHGLRSGQFGVKWAKTSPAREGLQLALAADFIGASTVKFLDPLKGELPDEGRRIQEVAPRRCARCPDRF